MKKLVFGLLALTSYYFVNAQLHSDFDSAINIFNNKINHNADKNNFPKLVNVDYPSQELHSDFVVQLQRPVLRFQYKVNDMDIYQATPDNLYTVKPDSTISFNMPVADIP